VYVAGDLKKPFVAFQLDDSDFPDEVQYFLSGLRRVPVTGLTAERCRREIARFMGQS
jgi:hypothetical protein